jgi:hypothetical protein
LLKSLSYNEKSFLDNEKTLPPGSMEVFEHVNPEKGLAANLKTAFGNYIADFDRSMLFWFSALAVVAGIFLGVYASVFPLGFFLFWLGAVYLSYDTVNMIRKVHGTRLLKRLSHSGRSSPYSVFFKLENQLEKFLVSLRSVTYSVVERSWRSSSLELQDTGESFLRAARVVTERIEKYAHLSLDLFAVIWRNNVYSITSSSLSPQQQALAIGNKCREAEAMLLRYRWLLGLKEIVTHLQNHIQNGSAEGNENSRVALKKILETFHLTMYGPVTEELSPSFETTPDYVPFKGRYFWHQQLPPFPIDNLGDLAVSQHARELIRSLEAVRPMKNYLQEQAAINCVTKSIADASASERGFSPAAQAKQLGKELLYEKLLELPEFRPDSGEVKDEIDKLVSEAKVSLGTENLFE